MYCILIQTAITHFIVDSCMDGLPFETASHAEKVNINISGTRKEEENKNETFVKLSL